MEQPLTAHKDGTVTGLAVEVGQTVSAGAAICELADWSPWAGSQGTRAWDVRRCSRSAPGCRTGTGTGSGTSWPTPAGAAGSRSATWSWCCRSAPCWRCCPGRCGSASPYRGCSCSAAWALSRCTPTTSGCPGCAGTGSRPRTIPTWGALLIYGESGV